MPHIPVLLSEVLSFLDPQAGEIFCDMNLGLGGHSQEILKRIVPNGKLIGFELDPRNFASAQKNLQKWKEQTLLFRTNFTDFKKHLSENGITAVDGFLFDLGISSLHVDEAARGFSFLQDGPLDMRFDPEAPLSAQEIIMEFSPEELVRIFREYGEEPRATFFGKKIAEKRKTFSFQTTTDLSDYIASISSRNAKGHHPATKIFQALRIAVNNELEALEKTLPQTVEMLKPGGRIAVISFHSLEDRIVKNFFRSQSVHEKQQKYPQKSASGDIPALPLKLITKKAILPSRQETEENPRARSARLRVAEKIL